VLFGVARETARVSTAALEARDPDCDFVAMRFTRSARKYERQNHA
jgi:hypothetical protein